MHMHMHACMLAHAQREREREGEKERNGMENYKLLIMKYASTVNVCLLTVVSLWHPSCCWWYQDSGVMLNFT